MRVKLLMYGSHKMNDMKKLILFFLVFPLSLSGYAFDFLAGGLKYSTNNDGTSVSVIIQDTSIEKVVIPKKIEYEGRTYKVTSLGINAFSDCIHVTSITIPSSVSSMGNYGFAVCESLSKFSVAKNNPYFADIEGVLFNKNKDTLLAYPNSKAERYVIPSSVVAIYEGAFCSRNALRSLTIPESVRYIGRGALSGCEYLSEVFCLGKIPPTIGFYRIGYLPGCIFYVPKSTGKIYSSAPGWAHSTLNCINIIEKGTVTAYKVTLKVAGTLSVVIGRDNLNKVIKLSISGPLNGTDIKIIRYKLPLLRILDLGDADIVSGGENYSNMNDTTIDNVIGDNMFDYIPYWESIVLPKSLTRIGEHAISHGARLQSITLLTKTPPVLALSSFMLNSVCKLHVPKGCDAAYAKDSRWKVFYTDYGNK